MPNPHFSPRVRVCVFERGNSENFDFGGDLQTQAGAGVGRGSAVGTLPLHQAHVSQVFGVRSLVFGR